MEIAPNFLTQGFLESNCYILRKLCGFPRQAFGAAIPGKDLN